MSHRLRYWSSYHTSPSISLDFADAGLPAVRFISKVGAVLQQSYLDAHRAKVESMSRFYMVSSFLEEGTETIYSSSL